MGDDFQFFNIILFAIIAAFFVFKLRNILGHRDGGRRQRGTDPLAAPPGEPPVALPETRDAGSDAAGVDVEAEEMPLAPPAVLNGLNQIKLADPRFSPREFLNGCRAAFEWILRAFAEGDEAALKPLLSEEVFAQFAQSIRSREATGQKLETSLVGIRTAEIIDAYMAGRTAHITVRFETQQISVLRDADGSILEGDPSAVIEVTDVWTFERDTRSADPNWTLVATGTPE
jgi:predicted lipid-binding transport protein (Tim44 family)